MTLNKRIKMDGFQLVALILIGLGSLGGILLVVAQSKSAAIDKTDIINSVTSENDILKLQLATLNTESSKLKKALSKRDKKIQSQTDKITELNNKLLDKSEYIEKYLSGGDNYPFVYITHIKGASKQKMNFGLRNPFDFPIYNIIVQGYNLDEFEKLSKFNNTTGLREISFDDIFKCQKVDYRNDLLAPLNGELSIGKCDIETSRFIFKIHTKNMLVIQKVVFLIIDQHFVYGYELYDFKKKSLLKNYFSEPKYEKSLKKSLDRINIDFKYGLIY